MPADTPRYYWKRSICAVHGSLAAGNGHLSISSSRSACDPVPHTTQLVNMTPEIIVQLYVVFEDDMPGDLRHLKNVVDHWKAKWEMVNVAERSNMFDDTIQEINPDMCPNMSTAVAILLVMSVSSVSAEQPFSAMRRLKNYLRSTMTNERLSGLALMHVHKNKQLNVERIIHQFSRQKNRRLALIFRPNEGEG